MLTLRNSAPSPRPAARPHALIAAELVMGLIAVPCGVLLIANGLGMSEDVLDRSPFDTFLVPGLLLAVVVGGSLLGAAWLGWHRHSLAGPAGVAAGVILLGWIVVEAAMISGGRMLQAVIFIWALVIIALAWPLTARQAAPSTPPEDAA